MTDLSDFHEPSYSLGFGEAWRTLRAMEGQEQPVPQRQDSLDDQLRDIATVAVEMGCYDAADWIKARRLPLMTSRSGSLRPRFLYTGNCPRCGEEVVCKATDGLYGLHWGHRCAGETVRTMPKLELVPLTRGAEIGWDDYR